MAAELGAVVSLFCLDELHLLVDVHTKLLNEVSKPDFL